MSSENVPNHHSSHSGDHTSTVARFLITTPQSRAVEVRKSLVEFFLFRDPQPPFQTVASLTLALSRGGTNALHKYIHEPFIFGANLDGRIESQFLSRSGRDIPGSEEQPVGEIDLLYRAVMEKQMEVDLVSAQLEGVQVFWKFIVGLPIMLCFF